MNGHHQPGREGTRQVKFLKGTLNRPFHFIATQPFEGLLKTICVHHDATGVLALEIVVQLSPPTWRLTEENEFFGLSQMSRGPSLAGSFDEAQPIELDLFLQPSLLEPRFGHNIVTLEQETQRLLVELGQGGRGELAREDAWTYLGVTQQVPNRDFAVGFRNRDYPESDSHFIR